MNANVTAPPFDAQAWVNLAAILLSPVIAVLITLWYQRRHERRATKMWVFTNLVSTRHTPLVDDALRAYHMIDVVFHDVPRVRTLWREYYEMLNNEGLANANGYKRRQEKNLEMVTEMAKGLGYGKAISALDVDRVYYPHGLGSAEKRNNEIADQLLRVLKGSKGFDVQPLE